MKMRQFWVAAATILAAVSAVRSSDAEAGQVPQATSRQGGTEYVTVRVPREYLQQTQGHPGAPAVVQQQPVQIAQPAVQRQALQAAPQQALPVAQPAVQQPVQPSRAKTLAAAVAGWTTRVTGPAKSNYAQAPRQTTRPMPAASRQRAMIAPVAQQTAPQQVVRPAVIQQAFPQQVVRQQQTIPQQLAQPAVVQQPAPQPIARPAVVQQANPQQVAIQRQAVPQPVARPTVVQQQVVAQPAPAQQPITQQQPATIRQPTAPAAAAQTIAAPTAASQPGYVTVQVAKPATTAPAQSQMITTVSAQQQALQSGLTPVPVANSAMQPTAVQQPAATAADQSAFVTVQVPRNSLTGPAPTATQNAQAVPLMINNNQLFGAAGQQLNVQRVIPISQPGSNGRRVRLVIARPNETQATFNAGTAYLEQCGGICGLNGCNRCNSGGCCESNCCPTESCCESGCNSCNDCCYQTCDPGHLFLAGVEATFLRARLDRASSSIQTFDAANNPLRNFSSDVVNDSNLNGAPRVWIGAERGCWGVVGRWFDYRAGDMDFGNPAEVPDVVGISQRLHAYAADVELTRRFCCNDMSGRFSFGARRASIDTQTSATLTSVIGPDTVTGTAETHREFDGTGITFGFEGNKPIGDPCSGLSWFLRARGSVLWGDAYSAAGTRTTLANGLGATLDNQFAVAATDDAEMTIAEIQTGIQCTHKLECVPALAFLRLAVEWQHWAGDADLIANANSTSAAAPGALINANASASQQTLDLVGLVLAAGFTY